MNIEREKELQSQIEGLRSELEREYELVRELRDALRHIATFECYTRPGEEEPHLIMMRVAERALAQQPADQPAQTVFKAGDRVRKRKGYPFPGVVVAAFINLSGADRYVVECTAPDVAGCLHIFSASQLEAEPDQPAQGERPAKPYHQPERGQRNPDPTPYELADPLFEAIWQAIKGWDVDTDGRGYHGSTGNEAAAILRAIRNLRGDQ